jgi:hypothetical protein
VAVDIIVTPTRIIRTTPKHPKPSGILWHKLSPEKLAQIRVLQELKARIEKETGEKLPEGGEREKDEDGGLRMEGMRERQERSWPKPSWPPPIFWTPCRPTREAAATGRKETSGRRERQGRGEGEGGRQAGGRGGAWAASPARLTQQRVKQPWGFILHYHPPPMAASPSSVAMIVVLAIA